MKSSASKRVSQKEIARILGVSPATVSNAFHKPHQLSAELRDRIIGECKKHGYHSPKVNPEVVASSVAGTICVILSDSLSYSFSDPVASLFLKGVSEVLADKNLQLLMMPGSDADSSQTSLKAISDGFIFYGAPRDPRIFSRIERLNKPLITVDFDQPGYGSINIDNSEGACELGRQVIKDAKHVAILGLRLVDTDRVCRITHEELLGESESVSRRRLQGYLKAASEAGITIPPEYIWTIPVNTPRFAEMATREALAHTPRPDLLLCMSDVFALAAVRTAVRSGLKVPDDIRVTGFDGITEAETNIPAITTVHQQVYEKGRIAASRLIKGDLTGKTVIETSVFSGESA